jgi:hypothetical protein
MKIVPTDPVGGVPRTKKQIQKRLTAGELEAFSTAYRAGSSIRELAQFFKINRTTVHAHVDTLGLPRRYPRLTPADVKEAAKLYQAGKSLIAIGRHFDVPVTRWLSRSGKRGWRSGSEGVWRSSGVTLLGRLELGRSVTPVVTLLIGHGAARPTSATVRHRIPSERAD